MRITASTRPLTEAVVHRLAASNRLRLAKSRRRARYAEPPTYFVTDVASGFFVGVDEHGVDLATAEQIILAWSS